MKKSTKSTYPAVVAIHGLSHDGRGIAAINHKTSFIQGALPNEKITYKIVKEHRSYMEGEMMSVIEASESRVKPPCPHFGVCGGCNLQHVEMSLQINLKQQTLLEQLKHFGNVEPQQLLSPLSAYELGYRRKARLGVKYVIKKEKLLVGFREKKSRYLADLDECVVLHPKVGKNFLVLRNLISSLSAFKDIPQIEIAMGDDEAALVIRHLVPLSAEDIQKLLNFGEKENFHIYLQANAPHPVSKLYPQDDKAYLSYTLPDENIRFLFHPLDFTQINLELNRLMVKQALSLMELKADDQVLDLFCGMGNFTLPLAKHVHHVTGVEGSSAMVERAIANAKYNQINNVNFYVSNLEAPESNAAWLQKSYDKILLDPPRVGAKEILPHLNTLSANTICYISCNPATLARDAGEMVHQYGYQLKFAGIMNMFPHTAHTEAMAIFQK